MRAAVMTEVRKPWTIRALPDPQPQAGQVVIRIRASGMCGTDLHVHHGVMPVPLPLVLGHEPVGVIEAIGAGVAGLRPGDRVGVSWAQRGCGRCRFCQEERISYCPEYQSWMQLGGGNSELMLAWATGCTLVPSGLSDEDAAVYEAVREKILSGGETARVWLRPCALDSDPVGPRLGGLERLLERSALVGLLRPLLQPLGELVHARVERVALGLDVRQLRLERVAVLAQRAHAAVERLALGRRLAEAVLERGVLLGGAVLGCPQRRLERLLLARSRPQLVEARLQRVVVDEQAVALRLDRMALVLGLAALALDRRQRLGELIDARREPVALGADLLLAQPRRLELVARRRDPPGELLHAPLELAARVRRGGQLVVERPPAARLVDELDLQRGALVGQAGQLGLHRRPLLLGRRQRRLQRRALVA